MYTVVADTERAMTAKVDMPTFWRFTWNKGRKNGISARILLQVRMGFARFRVEKHCPELLRVQIKRAVSARRLLP
jgi:hypothetical protein